ncbi:MULTISPECIES: D-hexose-6-phosphate mutarotase [unclassified Lysobacter]|uniref:D-hexose-6-phosphate mutarotase n=1 Tax=unclassified Lysobacter TaxID=2635362 RepID=UPI001BE9B436|nr:MULTISPECIES: D-hexose-6-phosphate mutarotase [unclassified Lysobacter]MBT2745045.1 D-hexose-6-phosphate mutarotase [Lysobacter sp. ISL-42]MBT2750981.1 D-hexose-6-phosphate mutarotase [Lysobacter sp. ISL-50]MBT2775926.1 D-hexose-6-phosphate mutarotase [Lysobacter sp. ISL-54]MBT2782828.1 D-hexose-6-phosphate mutarotase [Lysobacter sp. ISL-52]
MPHSLPASLHLDGPDASRVEASAFGAHLLSWRCRGRERLYLSPNASFGAGKAIRGGVPVIFPQFGERGDGPRHGFARTLAWDALDTAGSVPPRLAFALRDSAQTRRHWPYPFEAELDIEPAANRLRIALSVRNTGQEAFEFSAALHTYLRVADIAGTLVHGLEDRGYIDSTQGGAAFAASDAPVRFEGEIDRIYADTRQPLRVTDGEQLLRLEAEGFADTVVWNPGAELAAGLADLGAGEHRHFVCVEAGNVLSPVRLEPGAVWTGAQILTVEPSAGR